MTRWAQARHVEAAAKKLHHNSTALAQRALVARYGTKVIGCASAVTNEVRSRYGRGTISTAPSTAGATGTFCALSHFCCPSALLQVRTGTCNRACTCTSDAPDAPDAPYTDDGVFPSFQRHLSQKDIWCRRPDLTPKPPHRF